MKLSLSLTIISSVAAACGALKVNEAFLNEKEMDQFRGRVPVVSNANKQKQRPGAARRHGLAPLSASIARRMLSSVCTDDVCANKDVDGDFDLEVRTSLIERSTQQHVDHYSNGEQVHEDVGFVFLNTNPDAHFQHGDDVVPVMAGNLVTFKGDVTHNTVVKSGQVHLLGPFDMQNFKGVGNCFDDLPASDCCGVEIDDSECGSDCDKCFADAVIACAEACADCCEIDVTDPPEDVDDLRDLIDRCRDECDDGGPKCFSPSNTVEVQGKGIIAMDSLKIGDFVRAGKDQFSRVYSFLHLDRGVEADYLQIHSDGLKTPLEISPEHMVFVKNSLFPVRASEIKVGDMLGKNKVAEIKSVKRHGLYTPATETGDIVVSGALASCYAAIHSYTPINQHTEAHAFFALRRLVCAFNFGICEGETYTEDGFPSWLSPMVHFALSTDQNPPAQLFASVVGLPVIVAASILEQLIHYPLIVGAFVLGLIAFKKIKTWKHKVN